MVCPKLIADSPWCDGASNVLKRAKQMCKFKWTPVCALPVNYKDSFQGRVSFLQAHFPPWRPQIGLNYSAARFAEKYIGYNVSFETFVSALSNPNSVMYQRNLQGRHNLSSAYYGTVCSEFASYVFDMPFHIDCQQWSSLDGMEKIQPEPVDGLKLCDILVDPVRHIAVITGIDRDEQGRIVYISVSESTLPKAIETKYTVNEFIQYWINDKYEILRYHDIDSVSYTPDPCVYIEGDPELPYPVPNSILMPDYGNKANYMLGEKVVFSVFDSEYQHIEIFDSQNRVALLDVDAGKAAYLPEKTGKYRAVARCDGAESEPVEFCVVDALVALDKRVYPSGEAVKPVFMNQADDKLLGWVVKTAEFAKYWGYPMDKKGEVPAEAVVPTGAYMIIAMYRNSYGVYTSRPCLFDVLA